MIFETIIIILVTGGLMWGVLVVFKDAIKPEGKELPPKPENQPQKEITKTVTEEVTTTTKSVKKVEEKFVPIKLPKAPKIPTVKIPRGIPKIKLSSTQLGGKKMLGFGVLSALVFAGIESLYSQVIWANNLTSSYLAFLITFFILGFALTWWLYTRNHWEAWTPFRIMGLLMFFGFIGFATSNYLWHKETTNLMLGMSILPTFPLSFLIAKTYQAALAIPLPNAPIPNYWYWENTEVKTIELNRNSRRSVLIYFKDDEASLNEGLKDLPKEIPFMIPLNVKETAFSDFFRFMVQVHNTHKEEEEQEIEVIDKQTNNAVAWLFYQKQESMFTENKMEIDPNLSFDINDIKFEEMTYQGREGFDITAPVACIYAVRHGSEVNS